MLHLSIEQQFIEPAAGEFSSLELYLEEEFVVGLFEIDLFEVSTKLFGDVLFEFLSFVAVVVTDVNKLHVYPNDNIVSYSKG